MFFFFFSSRRRHTRLQGDWSSDVCSSDLATEVDRHALQLASRRPRDPAKAPEARRIARPPACDRGGALPRRPRGGRELRVRADRALGRGESVRDRKSTRLNSSHLVISYAVFCLKKKNKHAIVCQISALTAKT